MAKPTLNDNHRTRITVRGSLLRAQRHIEGLQPMSAPLFVDDVAIADSYDRISVPPPAAVCVLVPTRNEAGNIAPLLNRLTGVLSQLNAEVLFVDDSTDATPDVVRRVGRDARMAVRLLHRAVPERVGGLSGAVVAGLRATSAPWVVVMDGDLQHPPETIPALLDAMAADPGLDLVLASRYGGEGGADGLSSPARRFLSGATTIAAKLAFPRRLAAVSDPMTGFFVVRREALDLEGLHPRGFKILLEILARGPRLRVAEVPFTFAARSEGKSKATVVEGWRYLVQLASLRLTSTSELAGLLRFAAVGGSGVLVNLGALALVLHVNGRSPSVRAQALGATLATQVAIAWNFLLTELWVFSGSRPGSRRWARFAGFWLLSTAALTVQLPVAAALRPLLRGSYLLGTAAALGLLVAVRYLVCRGLLYRGEAGRIDAAPAAAAVVGATGDASLEVSR